MGTTAKHGLPWPADTDLLIQGDNAIRALAEAVDNRLGGSLFRATVENEPVLNDVDDLLELNLTAGDSSVFTDLGNQIRYNGLKVAAIVSAQVRWAGNGAGSRRIEIRQNGAEIIFDKESPDGTETTAQTLTWPVVLTDADTLGLAVRQTSGGSLNVLSGKFRCMILGLAP